MRASTAPTEAGERLVPPKPFLKWVGGKRQLLPQILARVPRRYGAFHEPFVGGGAVYFALEPARAFLSDSNERLIRTYLGVRDDCERVIEQLARLAHSREVFERLRTRAIDRRPDAEVAAWMIYLNRTGYNGLYRVNSKNQFNVPFGRYARPRICRPENLRACSRALAGAELSVGDFSEVLERAQPGDFAYFDPPYVPLSATSSFTSYTQGGFDPDAQIRLRDVARALKKKKVHVLLSNSSSPHVRELYRGFDVREVAASRNVNSKAEGRGKIVELLIS
jgi:DNA adenine methylase